MLPMKQGEKCVRMMGIWIVPVVFLWCFGGARAQMVQPAAVPLAGQDRIDGPGLVEDVRILREAFETMHPGLLRYNTAEEMGRRFDELQASVEKGATLGEFYLMLTRFTAGIRCGHTYPNFYNQEDKVAEVLFNQPARLPFYFRWLDGQMVVARDLTTNHALPAGTEILTIDGVAGGAILQRLMPLVRADGANDAKRVALLEDRGEAKWETFDVLYPLVYPRDEARRGFVLKVKTLASAVRTLQVDGMSQLQRESGRGNAKKSAGEDAAVFTKRMLPGNVMVITMPTWGLYDSKWDWRRWLNAAFDEAVKLEVKGVVLDLRENEGGLEDVGDAIVARLLREPLADSASKELVKFRDAPGDLMPYLKTWDKSFAHLGVGVPVLLTALPNLPAGTWLDLNGDDKDKTIGIAPKGPRYQGKVAVLVGAQNSSATFQFAQMVQVHHLARLVGEPTGGNQRGINGGKFLFLRLPRSGVEVDLPLVGYYPAETLPDAGLVPDVVVRETAEGLGSGVDLQMGAAVGAVR